MFVTPKDFSPNAMDFCGGNERTPYEGLTLSTFNKVQRPNQVYPIFVEKNTGAFVGIGRSLQQLIDAGEYVGNKEDFIYSCSDVPKNCVPVWPITIKGKPCVWRHIPERFISDWNKGYIKISRNKRKNAPNAFSIQYLPSGVIKKIEMGILKVIGHEGNAPTLIFGKNETVGGQIPTIWIDRNFYTVKGSQSLEAYFPENGKVFDYPKPVDLLVNVFQATSGDNDIILDSFAGSGTTAQAVLALNAKYGSDRKFILIEMEEYADKVTAERVKRCIQGYKREKEQIIYEKTLNLSDIKKGDELLCDIEAIRQTELTNYKSVSKVQLIDGKLILTAESDENVKGVDDSFDFYEIMEEPFFHDGENINPKVPAEEVRNYIYFMETRKTIIDDERTNDTAYLGHDNGTAYYLFYSVDSISCLNHALLAKIKMKAEQYVIYADTCQLSCQELDRYNITFKKIPRDITRL